MKRHSFLPRRTPLRNRSKKHPIEHTLDRLWSELVRGAGACERCGRPEALQAHHVVKRRYKATRWDLNAGVCLCHFCHRWAEEHPKDFERWFIRSFGELALRRLRDKAHASTAGVRHHRKVLEELRAVKRERAL